MTRLYFATTFALLPTHLLAHDAGGLSHAHPHGGEAVIALTALAAALVIWRLSRS